MKKKFPAASIVKSLIEHVIGSAAARAQRLAARMAGDPNAPIANGYLIFYLAVTVAAFMILGGAILEWHRGAAQGNVFVDILWRLTWIMFQVMKVTLIILLVIWVYRWFGRRGGEGQRE
jgi:hypothetical protein